jgi:hypothetical protein
MFKNIFSRKGPSGNPKKEEKPLIPKKAAEPKPNNNLIPLLSSRSIIVIVIGLILGLILGFTYWAFGPTSNPNEEENPQDTGGFLRSIGLAPAPPTEPWSSEVQIQVVNPGSSYVSITQLSSMGVYYAAKVKSLPFLQFLSQDLAEESPMYRHTVDELDIVINTKYDAINEQPTIVLQVVAPTAEEALFLSTHVPQVFEDFLISEENDKQQQTQANLLTAIDGVKKAIIEAEHEVNTLEAEGVSGIINDPSYIAMSTRVEALESELVRQATTLAMVTFEGNTNDENAIKQEYDKTLNDIEAVKNSIIEAEQKLNSLVDEQANSDVTRNPSYINLTAEIAALEVQIDTIMNGGIDTTTGLAMAGLAEMIANGTVTGAAYEDAKEKVDTASAALAEDRKQLAILESQANDAQLQITLDIRIAQTEVDSQNAKLVTLLDKLSGLVTETSADNTQANYERTSTALAEARKELAALQVTLSSSQLSRNLDYQIAQSRIDTLNNELSVLNDSLSSTFVNTGSALEAIDTLAVGNPSVPEIVYPERIKARNALAIGAILGMLIAWAILNYRWLGKVLTSSGEKTEESE